VCFFISANGPVIASPKGVAISYFTGLLRRPGKAGLLAMTTYLMRLYEIGFPESFLQKQESMNLFFSGFPFPWE
jgi:hypothetical protein